MLNPMRNAVRIVRRVRRGPQIPRIILPERVLWSILQETFAHPRTETGGTLLVIEPPGVIMILGIIPDIVGTVRSAAAFQLGGQDQVDIYHWYKKHWEAMCGQEPQMEDWRLGQVIPKGVVPTALRRSLAYGGDWHKHPGGMDVLSCIDTAQIRQVLEDKTQQRSQFLAPLVTFDPRPLVEYDIHEGKMAVWYVERRAWIDWYWVHEDDVNTIYHVDPSNAVPDNQVPWLPPLPWHLINPRRLEIELSLLEQAGYQVRYIIKEWDGNGNNDPHIQEIVFGIDHPSWDLGRLLVGTPWDYPRSEPFVRVLPKPGAAEGAELFEADADRRFAWLSEVAQKARNWWFGLTPPAETAGWYPNTHLIDVAERTAPQLMSQPVVVVTDEEEEEGGNVDDTGQLGQSEEKNRDDSD